MTTTSAYDPTAPRAYPVHGGPVAPSASASAVPVAPAPSRTPVSRPGPEEDFAQDLSALGPGGAAGTAGAAHRDPAIPLASEALAVELRPHSATQWIATYYPMVSTPAGRWAEVTWVLHQHLIPAPADPQEPAQWLQTTSPDPDHFCYTAHQGCAPELAAGYAAALATYDAETAGTTEKPLWLQQAQQQRTGTTVIPAGQLSEWVLEDLRDRPSS